MKRPQKRKKQTQRRSFYPLAFLLCALFIFWLPSMAAEKKSSSPWHFKLKAELGVRYDDNILSLSESEKTLVDDPALGGSELFGIESAADFIAAPEVNIVFARQPRKGQDTNFSLGLHEYKYASNSIKDYQEYTLSLIQELSRRGKRNTTLTAGASYIPEYFLRLLKDEDESDIAGVTIRNPLDYALNREYIELSHELINRLMIVEGGFALERRDFNHHFDERDSRSRIFSVGVKLYPLKRITFRLYPYYEMERRRAHGDLPSTTILDDDVGFDADIFALQLRWFWGQDRHNRNTFEAWAKREKRDFITSLATDTGHFDREDDITQFGLGYEREFGSPWELRFAYRHRVNDVSTLSTTGGRSTNSFKKNVYYATLVYRFDYHFLRSK